MGKATYTIKEGIDPAEGIILEQHGVANEIALSTLNSERIYMEKTVTEATAQKSVEEAIMGNVRMKYPEAIKKVTELEMAAIKTFYDALVKSRACENIIKDAGKSLEDLNLVKADIDEQIGEEIKKLEASVNVPTAPVVEAPIDEPIAEAPIDEVKE